jgi:hypothetical protein
MSTSFDPAAVSSLAEVLAQHLGALTFVPAADLSLWLPDLGVPEGWKAGGPERSTVTRMLLRRIHNSYHWDACEVLNLYRVPGVIPESLVLNHVDRTLRDSGAEAIESHRIAIPLRYNVIAARASGLLSVRDRAVRSEYTYYAVNSAAGGALIEQIFVVLAGAHALLTDELTALSTNLERALLASIDRAPRPQQMDTSATAIVDAPHDPESVALSRTPTTRHSLGAP